MDFLKRYIRLTRNQTFSHVLFQEKTKPSSLNKAGSRAPADSPDGHPLFLPTPATGIRGAAESHAANAGRATSVACLVTSHDLVERSGDERAQLHFDLLVKRVVGPS